jgi:hypothetical protein
MKTCRFCQKPMLPATNEFPGDMDIPVDHSLWECHFCPRTVKEYEDDDLWFSIVGFYNGNWYEVMQMYVCGECKDPPLTSIYKYTLYEDDQERPCIKSVLAFEISEDAKITPQNVDSKLALLLTFS